MLIKVIVFVEKGKVVIQEVFCFKFCDDYIFVKVNVVGFNFMDWKYVDNVIVDVGLRMGCDYVGIVEEVGSKVQKLFRKGDCISGVVYGG